MEPGSSQYLITLLILLVLSAFFSSSETALTSLNKIRVRNMVDEGIKNADLIQKTLENQSKLITAILIGNNIVNILASSIATAFALSVFGNSGVAIATGAITILVLIFGEITPKTFATENAEKVSVFVIKPIRMLMIVFTPFVYILNLISVFLMKILGVNNKNKPIVTESELLTMVNVSHEEGILEVDEREMINNVVEFGDTEAQEIMTPRTDLTSVDIKISYIDLMNAFKNTQFSKIPVYEESIDNIVGIISIKDLILIEDKENFDVSKYMRKPYFTYESKETRELLAIMRAKRISMAVVLDEYGGTSGVVTIQDLLEEIVGDISDEHDTDENEIKALNDNEFIIDGVANIDDVNDIIGTDFHSEDFDTIGGYVVGILGRFPEKGEVVTQDDVRFVVEKVDKNRIETLRVFTK